MNNKLFKLFVLTSLVALILACGLFSSTGSTPVAATQVPAVATDTPVVSTPLPSPTAVIASPTIAAISTPLPSPTVVNAVSGGNRIEFPTGGTWVEVGAHLDKDASITYVLSAIQGQVMSVSVEQMWPFTVEVSSASGILTDPMKETPFWRGPLPATQDYSITVRSQASGDFTLRVAINPPGQAHQYFEYSDPNYFASFRYSDEFAPVLKNPVAYNGSNTPSLVLYLIDQSFYTKTNLGEAAIIYSASVGSDNVANCTQPKSPNETVSGQETINGYQFTVSESTGVGAGNLYDQLIYRTVANNTCFEMTLYLHSGNIHNYDPGTVTEFDRAALVQMFKDILATFNVQ